MRALRAAGLALLVLLPCGVARAAEPPAGAVEEARQHFQRGIAFYKDGDFRSALVEFEEAYRASPNYRILFNVAQTSEELSDFAGAVHALREYLAQGGAEIPAARRADVERTLARLEHHVATLRVEVSEPGAEVVVEGERRIALGASPVAPLVVNGGAWTVRATKPGFEPAEQALTVAGGDERSVTLKLAPVAPPPPVSEAPSTPVLAPAPPPPPPPARDRTAFWIGVAATGALAAGAGITGALALSAKGDYDAALDRFGATAADVADARHRTRTFALATDVLGGAALVSAVITVVLYARPPHTRVGSIRPYVGPTSAGLSGAF